MAKQLQKNDESYINEELIRLKQEKIIFENEDKRQDAQRNMAWFALSGMLLYPTLVIFSVLFELESAAKILGDMAATYFVSVAAIVAAFYGKEALVNYTNFNSTKNRPLPPRSVPK